MVWCLFSTVITLRPRKNGRRFADDTFKRIFFNENVRILMKISLKFVPEGPFNNIPALVQIMAWRRSGDKPLSEPMIVSLLTHICVTRPQWVNYVKQHRFIVHSVLRTKSGQICIAIQNVISNEFIWKWSLQNMNHIIHVSVRWWKLFRDNLRYPNDQLEPWEKEAELNTFCV